MSTVSRINYNQQTITLLLILLDLTPTPHFVKPHPNGLSEKVLSGTLCHLCALCVSS